MTTPGQEFELDDDFELDETPFEEESATKAAVVSAKESLLKRRLIDDLLAERRLKNELKELDFDLDDDDD